MTEENVGFLQRVKEVLSERGWYRGGIARFGSYEDNYEIYGPVCLIGAIGVACGHDVNEHYNNEVDFYDLANEQPACKSIVECIKDYSEKKGIPFDQETPAYAIPDFNDGQYGGGYDDDESNLTTEQEIFEVLDCAIQREASK